MSENSTGKKNVLIVVSILGQFPEMLRIAQVLKNSPVFNPIIYFNMGIPGAHPCVKSCLSQGIDVLDFSFGYVKGEKLQQQRHAQNMLERSAMASVNRGNSILRLKHFIKYKSPKAFEIMKSLTYSMRKNILQIPSCVNRILFKLKRIRREKLFFDLLDVKLMIFAEDSEDYHTPQLIRIGHDRDVKSIIFPYTFANQYEFLEDAFFHRRTVKGSILNILTAKLFPKWSQVYKGEKLLKRPPAFIFSTEAFRISPPNPWMMSSGYADAFAVESAFMKQYYKQAGIPEDKMFELGFPSLDYLYETFKDRDGFRQQLAAKYGLDPQKPWIVCSVTPSQTPRCGVGFKSYTHFLNEYFGFLASQKNVEVLFKFHPRIETVEVRSICDQYHIQYIEEDTVELVAIADAYIASVSSTIRWALALGLPTINYDTYNYNYRDFEGAENYQVVFKMDMFKLAFENMHQKLLTTGPTSNREFQNNFAVLDGKAHQRIVHFFHNLVES